MSNLLRTALIAAAGLALGACATGQVDQSPPEGFADDPRLGERVDRICFGGSINSFGDTTPDTVILEARLNDHYLVETFGSCQDLDWAQSVALDQFSSCLTTADALIPYRSVFGPDRSGIPAQACRIKSIYEWDPEAEDAEDAAVEEETSR